MRIKNIESRLKKLEQRFTDQDTTGPVIFCELGEPIPVHDEKIVVIYDNIPKPD